MICFTLLKSCLGIQTQNKEELIDSTRYKKGERKYFIQKKEMVNISECNLLQHVKAGIHSETAVKKTQRS